jgi:ATP/maltotriose-dependent transcriptional regulator MalT
MGELAAGAVASERDSLLATKLNVPRLRPDLVPRPRLVQRLDQARGQGLVEPLVTALNNEVAGHDGALLLVLDDYHVISSPPVHESVRFLLEHRPPGLQLALASRSDPPLGLARLRARGELAELRAAELRFTPGEAAALLQQVAARHRAARCAAARYGDRDPGRPYRGLGGRAAAGRPVAARAG